MANNNGFADALNEINTLLNVDKNVEKDVLEDAAKYFVSKLKPRIKRSEKNKQNHLRDSLKVVLKDDLVSVEFEDKAFYWYMVEHGHKKANGKGKVKGQHFVRNTFDAESEKIAEMMANKIIDKMEG
ncbi:HK97 gp10 family phage protein [Fictibacillus sp. 7GRE50]|uniref:HK97-gp10 family putative phage morphogenesis protein n=1 Tax=Fictibacillus sp. 7GRE50 TaxID=2745878 RepID=UPI0018CDD2BD|nr:HK97-gp10 family putative phage morphogenesis protein [Fictibacillus sp. 7GRE50]MBH0166277.1 HK97 gp10 family phage protein [Fictibacillus sp. 7GRE50]